MANSSLPTKASSGTQDAGSDNLTQPAGSTPTGAPTNSVQPVIGGNALTSSGGIPLNSQAVPSVNLQTVQPGQGQLQAIQQPRHINPALFGISGLLLVVALAMFWSTTKGSQPSTVTASKPASTAAPKPVTRMAKKPRKKRNVKKKK